MSDPLFFDPQECNADVHDYTRLLQRAARGHVLWEPCAVGHVGDCGQIRDGRFWKFFNVYERPPAGIPRLDAPADPDDLRTTVLENRDVLRSSESVSVAFHGGLPFTVPPTTLSINADMSWDRSEFAFLGFGGRQRVLEVLSPPRSEALQRYLLKYERDIRAAIGILSGDIILLGAVTRAPAWMGGVARCTSLGISGNISFDIGAISVDWGASFARSSSMASTEPSSAASWALTRGPAGWPGESSDLDRSTVVVSPIRVKRRQKIISQLFSLLRMTTSSATGRVEVPGGQLQRAGPSELALTRASIVESDNRTVELDVEDANLSLSFSEDGDQVEDDLLGIILQKILDEHPSLEAVAGSWEVISEFLATHPNADFHSDINASYKVGEGDVAFLLALSLRSGVLSHSTSSEADTRDHIDQRPRYERDPLTLAAGSNPDMHALPVRTYERVRGALPAFVTDLATSIQQTLGFAPAPRQDRGFLHRMVTAYTGGGGGWVSAPRRIPVLAQVLAPVARLNPSASDSRSFMTSVLSALPGAATSANLAVLAQEYIWSDGKHDTHAAGLRALERIKIKWRLGLPLLPHAVDVDAVIDALVHVDGGVADRKCLLEDVFLLLAKLPRGTQLSTMLENRIVELLYRDPRNAPSSFLGRPPILPSFTMSIAPTATISQNSELTVVADDGSFKFVSPGLVFDTRATAFSLQDKCEPQEVALGPPYAYRMSDGSANNPLFPDLGRAGTAYARSITPTKPVLRSVLPDPGIVFDVLLRRREFKEHPTHISSIFFAFANIIGHSLFRTHSNDTINDTSSYLDLSPLYGHNEDAQINVRIRDGRGLMKDDTFADERVLMMPEAVGALLVLFCRNHNYIARRIRLINEENKFQEPTPEWRGRDPSAAQEQDDEIFNKARLVNCGYFMQIVLGDYLGSILGTTPEGSEWSLDPLQPIRTRTNEVVPRGEGNMMSVEFNLLYRLHASVSEQDEELLTKNVYEKIFPGKPPDALTKEDFIMGVGSWTNGLSKDPGEWDLGTLTRQANGRFKDDDLARVMNDATTSVAGAFGARGTPPFLRIVEILAIERARRWGVCSLNEFRKFMGLRPYSSFEEWNPDPEIHEPAMRMYGNIEHLELYVGLQAEEVKLPRSGVGLCAGFTASRAIMAHTIYLVRGDRFLTTDLTPFNLSSWGFQDCARDLTNGSFGGQLSKLLMRTLPDHYNERSIYAHFPMITPPGVYSILAKLDLVEKYDFGINSTAKKMQVVWTAMGCRKILQDWHNFPVTYTSFMKDITDGYGMYLAHNDAIKHRRDRLLIGDALFAPGQIDLYARYYFDMTRQLIREKSYTLVGRDVRCVDIVRDVVNLVPVYWASEHVAGVSLKTHDNPRGAHSDMEVYQMTARMFEFIFLNTQPVGGWNLREQSMRFSQIFLREIKSNLQEVAKDHFSLSGAKDAVIHWMLGPKSHTHDFLHRLCSMNTDATIDELAYSVMGTIVASVPDYGQAAAHVINFYLEDEHCAHKEHICRLSLRIDDESNRLLTGYVLEALRLDPQTPGLFRDIAADTEVDQGPGLSRIHLHRGERVFINLARANVDPEAFGTNCAHTIDPERALQDYLLFRHGAHTDLKDEFLEKTMPQVIRAVFSLKNIRRAPGSSGQLNRFTVDWHGAPCKQYVNSKGAITPWPQSLVIQYDV